MSENIEKKFSWFPLIIFIIILSFYIVSIYNYEISLTKYVYIENLINYEGGIVRRGFLGNVIYYLNYFTKIKAIYITTVLYSFLYLILIFLLYGITKKLWFNNVPLFILIVCSPSTILFPIFDFNALFRKEVFFFIIYFYHVLIAQKVIEGTLTLEGYNKRNLFLISPIILINILIHEFQFFLILFHVFINLIVSNNKISKNTFFTYIIYVLVFCIFLFPASNEALQAINQSLEKFLPGITNEYSPVTILSGNINLQLGQTLWFIKNSSLNNFFQLIFVFFLSLPLFLYFFLTKLSDKYLFNNFKKIISLFNIYLLFLFCFFIILSFDSGRLINILLIHLIGFYLIFPAENYKLVKLNLIKKVFLFCFICIYLIFFYLPSGPILAGKGTIFEKSKYGLIKLIYLK